MRGRTLKLCYIEIYILITIKLPKKHSEFKPNNEIAGNFIRQQFNTLARRKP